MVRDTLICVASVLATILFVILYFFFAKQFQIFSYEYIVRGDNIEKVYVGKEDISLLISSITSFYSTAITLLIALLALISSIAFIVVRASASDAAERAAAAQVPMFLQSKDGKELIQKSAEARVEERMQKLEDAFQALINVLEDSNFNLTEVANVLRGADNEKAD